MTHWARRAGVVPCSCCCRPRRCLRLAQPPGRVGRPLRSRQSSRNPPVRQPAGRRRYGAAALILSDLRVSMWHADVSRRLSCGGVSSGARPGRRRSGDVLRIRSGHAAGPKRHLVDLARTRSPPSRVLLACRGGPSRRSARPARAPLLCSWDGPPLTPRHDTVPAELCVNGVWAGSDVRGGPVPSAVRRGGCHSVSRSRRDGPSRPPPTVGRRTPPTTGLVRHPVDLV